MLGVEAPRSIYLIVQALHKHSIRDSPWGSLLLQFILGRRGSHTAV